MPGADVCAILPVLLTAILLPAEAEVQRKPEPEMLFIGEANNGKFPDYLCFLRRLRMVKILSGAQRPWRRGVECGRMH